MFYISDSKLNFIFESYLKISFIQLHTAQLQGLFKQENFVLGKIDVLENLIHDLNLKIDVDKFKF